MDDQKKLNTLADLQSACEAFAASISIEYEAMPVYAGEGSVGVFGGTFKADANGKPWARPWETTPLRTLALHPELASAIALKYGVPQAEILELGAWNLPDNDASTPFGGFGASTYFARLSLSNGAVSKQAFSGWLAALNTDDAESARVNAIVEQNKEALKRHMRQIQNDGRNATINQSNNLAAKMLQRFKTERRLQPHAKISDLFKNVAQHLNDEGTLTLQKNKHTGESIRKILKGLDLS